MPWTDRFEARPSALCVGLDPVPARLPPGTDCLRFCLDVVEICSPHAACFKPNVAFFERLGPRGMEDFATLLREIRARGFPVIADVKRGDIGSTAEAYADAYFGGPFDADAITVNPSVGLDAIEPFRAAARRTGRGIFLLLRTSNPGAALFQAPAEPALLEALRAEPHFGAVVGATDPAAGARLREALPGTLFLVPGFGAQGGEDLGPFFRRGGGAVVNSSRAILFPAEGGGDWRSAVERAAKAARDAIEKARAVGKAGKP
jgi:orotidine-5'-phosphate decarboxylase